MREAAEGVNVARVQRLCGQRAHQRKEQELNEESVCEARSGVSGAA